MEVKRDGFLGGPIGAWRPPWREGTLAALPPTRPRMIASASPVVPAAAPHGRTPLPWDHPLLQQALSLFALSCFDRLPSPERDGMARVALMALERAAQSNGPTALDDVLTATAPWPSTLISNAPWCAALLAVSGRPEAAGRTWRRALHLVAEDADAHSRLGVSRWDAPRALLRVVTDPAGAAVGRLVLLLLRDVTDRALGGALVGSCATVAFSTGPVSLPLPDPDGTTLAWPALRTAAVVLAVRELSCTRRLWSVPVTIGQPRSKMGAPTEEVAAFLARANAAEGDDPLAHTVRLLGTLHGPMDTSVPMGERAVALRMLHNHPDWHRPSRTLDTNIARIDAQYQQARDLGRAVRALSDVLEHDGLEALAARGRGWTGMSRDHVLQGLGLAAWLTILLSKRHGPGDFTSWDGPEERAALVPTCRALRAGALNLAVLFVPDAPIATLRLACTAVTCLMEDQRARALEPAPLVRIAHAVDVAALVWVTNAVDRYEVEVFRRTVVAWERLVLSQDAGGDGNGGAVERDPGRTRRM